MTINPEIWLVTGSQHLYGDEALREVAAHAQTIASALNDAAEIPVRVVYRDLAARPEEVLACCRAANNAPECIGLVCWMHTFSPAKMWIGGLNELRKPFSHLHTQFNAQLPWGSIDMDFMNLNQSAHGGREFGFIGTRMRRERTVVVGHWQDPTVLARLGTWARAARAWDAFRTMKVARFGDNMREVAVTEGDKVAAQIHFGLSVNGYGVGDLVERISAVHDAEADRLVSDYLEQYEVSTELRANATFLARLGREARIEIGIRQFLKDGAFSAFTDTFEDLHGLPQLPGLAVQRLMADGYGFGAEGDWKTAALVRAVKVMAEGLPGGTSFMEDYTYHFTGNGGQVLGAHMLEICPSIAQSRPALEMHPLEIGGKDDPVRLVFTGAAGPAINAAMIDLGNRFRLLVNEVTAVDPENSLPQLPVARALWVPKPDLPQAAAAWILAGGPHHTAYSQAVTAEHLQDFAEMADVELVQIDQHSRLPEFKKELRWNEMYYHLAGALRA